MLKTLATVFLCIKTNKQRYPVTTNIDLFQNKGNPYNEVKRLIKLRYKFMNNLT